MKEEAIGDTVATEEKFRRNCLLFSLTAREQLVAKSILDGAPYKQIASSLGISEGTIRTHVQISLKRYRCQVK